MIGGNPLRRKLQRVAPATVRARLTAWYAAIFFVAGALLLGGAYVIVRANFDDDPSAVRDRFERVVVPAPAPSDVRPRAGPASAPPVRAMRAPVPEPLVTAQSEANSEALGRTLLGFASALVLVTLLSLGAGWAVAGRALRPVQRITATAKRVSETNLHERIGLSGPSDELRELADTFDGMLVRLEAAFASQQRFVASASHELRTPLAIMRAELDVTMAGDPSPEDLRRTAETLREAIDRSERLVASLLVLARSESGPAGSDPVDVGTIAAEVVRDLEPRARAAGVALEAGLRRGPAIGDPELIRAVILNLLENAVRYNRPNGWAALRVGASAGTTRLVVENSGPVIPEEQAEALLEPFRRHDCSRGRETGGAGLGLSIVKAAAEAHGGRLTLDARPEGGLKVTVDVPSDAGAPGYSPESWEGDGREASGPAGAAGHSPGQRVRPLRSLS